MKTVHHNSSKIEATSLSSYIKHLSEKALKHNPKGSIVPKVVIILYLTMKRLIRTFKRFFQEMTFEQKYILVGILLGNLPDLDVFLSPFFGGHYQFHRTFTHSIWGNLVLVPTFGFITKRLLGLQGWSGYAHSTLFVGLCVASHLITDVVTNYGTCILYPFNQKRFSLGLITVFDFTTVVFFYIMLTISKSGKIKQSHTLLYTIIGFSLLMIWKRAMLYDVDSRTFHFVNNLKRKNRGCTIWLQPSNWKDGSYTIIKFDHRTKVSSEIKTYSASPFSLIRYILETFIGQKDIRKIREKTLSPECVPKEFFSNVQRENKKLFYTLLKSTIPTILFILGYHIFYLYKYLSGKKKFEL
jgi:membrane-bound metal-dependent hydrolase YbcI (DUF457 family)